MQRSDSSAPAAWIDRTVDGVGRDLRSVSLLYFDRLLDCAHTHNHILGIDSASPSSPGHFQQRDRRTACRRRLRTPMLVREPK